MQGNDRDLASLWDMRQAIREIQEDTDGLTYAEFERNRTVRRAVERNFEILGEAASRVSDNFRDSHLEIDWRKIVGLRNVIIHRYEQVDPQVLWGYCDGNPTGATGAIREFFTLMSQ
ncbi:MAG: DUF86 domain-containing protein [Synechococcus sp.]